MDIKGKITLFIDEKTNEKGEVFRRYSTSLSSKDKDGNYLNKTVDVKLAGKNFPAEKVAKMDASKYYRLDVNEGFISVKKGKDEKTYLELIITDAKCLGTGVKTVKVVQDSLPF